MKITLLLLALCLAISLTSAVHMKQDKRNVLVNRPSFDAFGPRPKRAPWPRAKAGVKGVKTAHAPAPTTPLEMRVRKGEYVCGNKICKLTPGVEPKGCNGICQYPVRR